MMGQSPCPLRRRQAAEQQVSGVRGPHPAELAGADAILVGSALMRAPDPAAKLRKLSIAQRQMVEICKALLRNARVIALDEPTSSLSQVMEPTVRVCP